MCRASGQRCCTGLRRVTTLRTFRPDGLAASTVPRQNGTDVSLTTREPLSPAPAAGRARARTTTPTIGRYGDGHQRSIVPSCCSSAHLPNNCSYRVCGYSFVRPLPRPAARSVVCWSLKSGCEDRLPEIATRSARLSDAFRCRIVSAVMLEIANDSSQMLQFSTFRVLEDNDASSSPPRPATGPTSSSIRPALRRLRARRLIDRVYARGIVLF